MPRLLHLAPESATRSIERAGIRGERRLVLVSGDPIELRHAVYAMPVLPDFSTTHQWLRELRRWHDERLVAVHFLLPSTEKVYVGRYGAPHARVPLGEAIARVMQNPAGSEIVVPRSIGPREVRAVRALGQLVGWTEVPEANRKFECLCTACVPPGTRTLMRRVHAAFERFTLAARQAKSTKEILAALERLDTPLERAHGRIEPTKVREAALDSLARLRGGRRARRATGFA